MQARGLVPPQLDPLIEMSASGYVSLRQERRLHPGDSDDIGTLALRARTRSAVVRARVGSIADLNHVLRQGLLKVRDIGELSTREITEKLRREST